jgi:tetrahydromethanopterin S-methyltransferase subunit B
MSGASVCKNCGASVRLPASACWMCRAPLIAVEAAPAVRPRDDASAVLGLLAVALVALVLGVIFVALLFEAPGVAVIYAVLAVPLVGGLGAVAFAVRARGNAPATGASLDQRGDARPSAGGWLDSAAKATVIVLGVLVGTVALGMVALVFFMTVCFAIIAATYGLH